MQVNWNKPDAQEAALTAPVCRGFMIFMKNNMTMPKAPGLEQLYAEIEPDRDAVFSSYREFHAHHENRELMISFAKAGLRE